MNQKLKCIYEESNKVFGKANKQRTEDPDMFALLSWQNNGEQVWDFKKNTIKPDRDCESKKFINRINHERQSWKTEVQDNYRKIEELDNMKVQEIDRSYLQQLQKECTCKRDSNIQRDCLCQEKENYKQDLDWYPKIQSHYREQYQIKNIKCQNQLMEQLEQNNQKIKGEYQMKDQEEMQLQDNQNQFQQLQQSQECQNNNEENDYDDLDEAGNFIRKLDLNDPNDKAKYDRRKKRIKSMDHTTRWLPDSSMTTYYGKPAWGPYGYHNTKPVSGGIFYGTHMYTHNVQPHRLENKPIYQQSYNNALTSAQNVIPEVVPQPPRLQKEELRLTQKQVDTINSRNQLTLNPFQELKKKITDSKGTIKLTKDLTIRKPDLVNTMRFASEVEFEPAKKPRPRAQSQQKQRAESVKVARKSASRVSSASQKLRKKQVDFKEKEEDKDSLNLPDKSQKKFIEEMKKKKEHQQRFTEKVNKSQEQRIDDMNPPVGYRVGVDERNPKNYRYVPHEWMGRIPYAGKKEERGLQACTCLDFGY